MAPLSIRTKATVVRTLFALPRPARRLLATFPIVSTNKNRVVVDFNKGMRRVFTEAWTSSGFNLFEHDQVLEVPDSRVFEMRLDQDRVIIRQSVQARNREYAANLESRYEMRFASRFLAGFSTPDRSITRGKISLKVCAPSRVISRSSLRY